MPHSGIEFHYRFCPHCGAENPSPGDIPFKCAACGFANFFGPVAAVGGLIINQGGELLLVRRARDPGKGLWGLPGGFVDRQETAEAALLREIEEETRLVVTQPCYLMSHPNSYCYHGAVAPVIDIFFVCRIESASMLKLAPEELDHFEWARPTAKHLDHMAFHSNRVAIEFWLSSHDSPSRNVN
jgi:ADP-ribose pyrophosphatase YjhB (NUDIX family)